MSLFDQIKPDRPLLMAILNITPDSFSDGGVLFSENRPNIDSILQTAEAMLEQGADLLDVGGESTRPGASRPSAQQELDRVLPVIEVLRKAFDCPVSVDTSRIEVMQETVKLGVDLINDVRALSEPETLGFISESEVLVCLMHMQGEPGSMQDSPDYVDPVEEVYDFLQSRVNACLEAGINRQNIAIDPGFGFGKTQQHNMSLMVNLPRFTQMGLPLLVGVSRKGMIGNITNRSVEARLAGSLAMAQAALDGGANILRVHDVAETCDMMRVWTAIKQAKEQK
jgi:dihydropteroate synthase